MKDSDKLVMGYMLVFVYVNLMLSKMNCVEQRFWLSVIGILRYNGMKVPYYDDDDCDGDDGNKRNELRQPVKQFQIHFYGVSSYFKFHLTSFKFCIYLLVGLMLQRMLLYLKLISV